MATAIETVGTGTGTAGDVDITKPTSLADGDMMIAFITSATSGTNGVAPHTTPASWTTLGSVNNGTNNTIMTIAAKVADSSDAAASNFSFTSNGDNGNTIGVIARISGTNGFASPAINVVSNIEAVSATTTPSISGVTTIAANSILLMGIAAEITDGDLNFSGYAVANSNPTWTEEQDLYYEPSGIAINLGVASATYATAQATGNASGTISSLVSSAMALICITENINATGTVATAASTQSAFEPAGSAGTTGSVTLVSSTQSAFTPIGKASSKTQWTNEAPESTTWINEEDSV